MGRRDKEGTGVSNFARNALLWLVIIIVLVAVFNLFQGPTGTGAPQLAYSDFLSRVEQGQVQSVTIQGNNISGQSRDGGQFTSYMPKMPR